MVIALLYFLIRRNWELGLVLAVCAAVTAVLFLMPPLDFLRTVGLAMIHPSTLSLLAIVACILILSNCMRESGALEELVGSLRSMLGDNRFTIGVLPALIGLLPMPGGALFSAPMIEGLADEAKLSAENRTYLNYWFRHVWEYSYPLYPSLLLTAAIVSVDITELIRFQFPLSLGAILGGSIFGLLQIPRLFRPVPRGAKAWGDALMFLHGFWPVLLIILTVVILRWELLIMLPVALVLFGWPRLGLRRFVQVSIRALNYRVLGTILSVLVFKDVIAASGCVEELPGIFEEWGIPPVALLMLLPAVLGYLTGIAHSFVSVAFPLLMPFFGDPVDLGNVQLAFTFGFAGVLLSPVHLCLVLSSDYFRADMYRVFPRLYLPVLVLMLTSIGLYLT